MFDLKKLWQHYETASTFNRHRNKKANFITNKVDKVKKTDPTMPPTTRRQLSHSNKSKYSCNNKDINKSFSFKLNESSIGQQSALKNSQTVIIEKIFNILDVKGNGWINQLSINQSKLPQSILYFFGSIFQIIKLNKLKINLFQFKQKTQQIFNESTEEDIIKLNQCLKCFKIQSQKKTQNFQKQNNSIIRQSKVEAKYQIKKQSTKDNKISLVDISNIYNNQIISSENHRGLYQPQKNNSRKVSLFIKKNGNQTQKLSECKKVKNQKNDCYYDQKIDKLSNRVEDYIKINAARLAISKQMRQNI